MDQVREEKESPIASTTGRDVTRTKFWSLILISSAISALIRHYKSGLHDLLAEQLLYYFGQGLSAFIWSAILVLPFHGLGKLMKNGYSAPKKLILIWGFLFLVITMVPVLVG